MSRWLLCVSRWPLCVSRWPLCVTLAALCVTLAALYVTLAALSVTLAVAIGVNLVPSVVHPVACHVTVTLNVKPVTLMSRLLGNLCIDLFVWQRLPLDDAH